MNNNLDIVLAAIKSDGRLSKLIDEIEKALEYYTDDDRNKEIRETIIFKQFADKLLTDRERAVFYHLPEGCRMRENAKIISPENLTCGKYVWIGENAVLDASGGLEVGDHTSIGLSVYIWTHSSHNANLNMENYPNSKYIERQPTKIGCGVFIGGPSVVNAGVTIGDRTIVLPMSNVTKSFEGNCILGGSPARRIKEL